MAPAAPGLAVLVRAEMLTEGLGGRGQPMLVVDCIESCLTALLGSGMLR